MSYVLFVEPRDLLCSFWCLLSSFCLCGTHLETYVHMLLWHYIILVVANIYVQP
uniref:Uncharacterized protein n=1 Tax=Aegilops tauschii subsp. strangulata TaxID=200361 RepID=A0A453RF47_AEGTS